VHVLSPAVLGHVPADPFAADVNRHVYPPLMSSGAVRGFVTGGYWNDLGTPARYLAANRDVLLGRVPLARFAGADPFGGTVEIAAGVRAAADARIHPAARLVAPAFVGARCAVPAGATVRDAVIWADTALAPGEAIEHAVAAGALRVPADG
jgi:mannose-1-phosphate guanylyltransferase